MSPAFSQTLLLLIKLLQPWTSRAGPVSRSLLGGLAAVTSLMTYLAQLCFPFLSQNYEDKVSLPVCSQCNETFT